MSDDRQWNIQLRLPAEPEFLGVVRLASAGIAHRLDLDHEESEDLKLVVTEACGHLLNLGAQDIEIQWSIDGEELDLRVQAMGEIDEEDADDQADLEWKEIGLVLINSLMDEVQETKSPPGLRLKKRSLVRDD